jgi:hypothetical protein
MPWTENPWNVEARAIRDAQLRLGRQLFEAATDGRFRALVENSLPLEDAIHTLQAGFGGSPTRRFFSNEQSDGQPFTTDALPGIVVHVMGPSRQGRAARAMNPPSGRNYLATAAASERLNPFLAHWRSADPGRRLRDEDRRTIEGVSASDSRDDLALAAALDRALNETSLMLLFQLGRAHLLFAGDAQLHSWRNAASNPHWRESLERTNFHKRLHDTRELSPKSSLADMALDAPEDLILRDNVSPPSTQDDRPWIDVNVPI